jgi:hypothetical protein
MATVIRLNEAMKSGSQGVSSFLEGPAARTARKRRTRAAAAVKGPNLDTVSNHSSL